MTTALTTRLLVGQMDPERRAAWVAGLRSHEFEQGRNRLCDVPLDGPPAYCCLGVLCELAAREDVLQRHATFGSQRYGNGGAYSTVMPPSTPEFAEWLGVTLGELGQWFVVYKDKVVALSELNDILMLTFEQIADLIESCPAEVKAS